MGLLFDADDRCVDKKPQKDEKPDERGLDARDIELVMSQANVSRSRAVRALRKCGGDCIGAIFDISLEWI